MSLLENRTKTVGADTAWDKYFPFVLPKSIKCVVSDYEFPFIWGHGRKTGRKTEKGHLIKTANIHGNRWQVATD